MVTYGFFNSQNGDRKYNADQMSDYFKGLISDGVYESVGDGMVVEATEGMTVSIGNGRAVIDCKWINNSASELIEITMADPINPRYTAIVVRLDENRRLMEFDTVDGDAAADPDYPAATWTDSIKELVLAYVYVSAGATSISQSDITDARSLDVCGWVTGLIDHISIENLYLQWVDKFNQYFEDMEAQFQEWFDSLTEQLNVNTYIAKFDKKVEITDTNIIDLDMVGYTYDSNDAIDVFINGLHGIPVVDYTLDVSGAVPTITTLAEATGTIVEIRIFKSKIGFNPQIDMESNYVVTSQGNNIAI